MTCWSKYVALVWQSAYDRMMMTELCVGMCGRGWVRQTQDFPPVDLGPCPL